MAWWPTPSGLSAYRRRCAAPPIARRRWSACCRQTAEQVCAHPALCRRAQGVPIVPRGAGTSLSGGALPRADGILIGMGRMKPHPGDRLRESLRRGRARRHQSHHHPRGGRRNGFYYAPDPSSQIACTIGGNVAENSGGLHCLKYGLTTNNLLGVDIRAAGRRDRHPGRQGAGRRAGSICWAWSPARKACWAWWWK